MLCLTPSIAHSTSDVIEKLGSTNSYVIVSAEPKDTGLYSLHFGAGNQRGTSLLSVIVRGKLLLCICGVPVLGAECVVAGGRVEGGRCPP